MKYLSAEKKKKIFNMRIPYAVQKIGENERYFISSQKKN